MNLISAETCVRELNKAAINRKDAFQIELAVGLAIFVTFGAASKEARQHLNDVYSAAGYDCTTARGMDYKTINRRINASAMLFEKVAATKWAGKHSDTKLINAMCLGLEPYEFATVRDVQRYCGPKATLPKRQPVPVAPAPEVLTPTTGQAVITSMFRRASDRAGERVQTEHVTVTIPPDTPSEELVELARKLLEFAASHKELLTA